MLEPVQQMSPKEKMEVRKDLDEQFKTNSEKTKS
jgi:hypothetical protein